MMKLNELKTATGMTWEEVKTKMQENLPDEAYKPIAGVAGGNLTDIDSTYMLEVITECFGPCGVGWGLTYRPEDLFITDQGRSEGQNRFLVSLNYANFWYATWGEGEDEPVSRFVTTSGGSTSSSVAFAIKGAQTSAISSAVSRLLFQIEVYKGHHKAPNPKPPSHAAPTAEGAEGYYVGGATKKMVGYIFALLGDITPDWAPKADIERTINDLVNGKKMTFEKAKEYIEQLKQVLENQREIGV